MAVSKEVKLVDLKAGELAGEKVELLAAKKAGWLAARLAYYSVVCLADNWVVWTAVLMAAW